MSWCYLSFASDRFLGACIVEGEDVITAAANSRALGINPGGEVLCIVLADAEVPPDSYRNRLLSIVELKEVWPGAKSIAEHNNEDRGLN